MPTSYTPGYAIAPNAAVVWWPGRRRAGKQGESVRTTEFPRTSAVSSSASDSAGPFDLELSEVTKAFDSGVVAVDGLSLQVEPGELVSLLGPSGCGKTTTLRIIAGFAVPDGGRVILRDVDVTPRPPNKRDIGLVFQSYALFPHMTVAANVAYGLKMRRVAADDSKRRVAEALEMVRLSELAHRYPRQLSGGQQQRVALARAVVIRPSVLLLDEPLSNLDAKLRQEMRAEIRQLQRHLRLTTVFVTHDQEEALTISDRIVVMNRGRVEQAGSPHDIYRRPRTLFVAQFIGEGNFLEGTLGPRTDEGVSFVTTSGLRLVVEDPRSRPEGDNVTVNLRPETVALLMETDPDGARYVNRLPGTLEDVTYLGGSTTYRVRVDAQTSVRVVRQNQEVGVGDDAGPLGPGARVVLGCQPAACQIVQYR